MERYRKCFLAVILFTVFSAGVGVNAASADDKTFFIRVEPQKYKIRTEVNVSSGKNSSVAYIPFPQNTVFQVIENIAHSPGEIYESPSAPGETYLKVTFPNGVAKNTVLFNEFYATLWCGKADFSKITEFYSYDTESTLYRQYTRAELPIIDPNHAEVQRIVAELTPKAADDLEFARLTFLYVLENIKQTFGGYKYSLPLENTLNRKEAPSYGMHNMIVSILRGKGIPARNVIAFNVSGSRDIWPEFYLENYGWIPLKITNTGDYIDPETYFGMTISPPHWSDRQPHSLVTRYTIINGELPGVTEEKTIKYSAENLKIHVQGAMSGSAKVTIEKVEN